MMPAPTNSGRCAFVRPAPHGEIGKGDADEGMRDVVHELGIRD